MFASLKLNELTNKSKFRNDLNKLFIRVFPEYIAVVDELLIHEDLIDMLKEFKSCEQSILKLNNMDGEAAIYRELMIELKQEMLSFIARHIGKQNSSIK